MAHLANAVAATQDFLGASACEQSKIYNRIKEAIKAKVDAVDVAKREVTLTGPPGRTVTLKVGEQVKNLAQKIALLEAEREGILPTREKSKAS